MNAAAQKFRAPSGHPLDRDFFCREGGKPQLSISPVHQEQPDSRRRVTVEMNSCRKSGPALTR